MQSRRLFIEIYGCAKMTCKDCNKSDCKCDKSAAEKLSDAFGFLRLIEVRAIEDAVNSLPPNPHIVNIGAGAGTSGLAIIQRGDAFLTTIDIRQNSPLGSLQSEINAFNNSGIDYKDRHKQILKDSKEVAKEWTEKVDMVFIDGEHSYPGACGDIEGWLPHIKEGGLMLVHDYNPTPWGSVVKAVDDLLLEEYEQYCMEDTTIGFIIK